MAAGDAITCSANGAGWPCVCLLIACACCTITCDAEFQIASFGYTTELITYHVPDRDLFAVLSALGTLNRRLCLE